MTRFRRVDSMLRRYSGVACALMLLIVVAACTLDPTAPSATSTTSGRPLGADTLLLLHSVPWGAFTLDGKALAAAGATLQPAAGGQAVPALALPQGRHALDYSAAPFPALHCQVSAPAAVGDTCPLFQPPPKYPVQNTNGSRILDMGATVDQLSASQSATLQSAAQARLNALTASAQVAAGQLYLGDAGTVRTADTALVGSAFYTLNQDAQDAGPWPGRPCPALCESYPGASFDHTVWTVDAHVIMQWRYTTVAGQLALDHAQAASPERLQHVRLQLSVVWSNGWQVSLPTQNARTSTIVCLVAMGLLNDVLSKDKADPALSAYTWYPVAARPTAEGCLLIGGKTVGSNGVPTGATVYALYRFGVLLAANDEAQRRLPQAPVADAAAQALARRLAGG